jgi:hypothetical protein
MNLKTCNFDDNTFASFNVENLMFSKSFNDAYISNVNRKGECKASSQIC